MRWGKTSNAAQTSNLVMDTLKAQTPDVTLKKVDFVGPQVGKELYDSGALALFVVVIGIMIYLALRFEWRFALSGVIANAHDVVIILGLFAFFQWEFTLTVLAGILAILGYRKNGLTQYQSFRYGLVSCGRNHRGTVGKGIIKILSFFGKKLISTG